MQHNMPDLCLVCKLSCEDMLACGMCDTLVCGACHKTIESCPNSKCGKPSKKYIQRIYFKNRVSKADQSFDTTKQLMYANVQAK